MNVKLAWGTNKNGEEVRKKLYQTEVHRQLKIYSIKFGWSVKLFMWYN